MALQGKKLETTEQWEAFFVNELKVSMDIARRYAAAMVDEGYDEESIKYLLSYSAAGLPSSLLLELGLKVGHCLRLAMYFNSERQPLQLIHVAEFPFQHIRMEAFEVKKHHYLVTVDRYSGWNLVFILTQQPKDIIRSLRSLFPVYGVPELLFSDGRLQFKSHEFKEFLSTWKIAHITSTARYTPANDRAELAVKAAKRAIEINTDDEDHSLNTRELCRALLQYRNTPMPRLGLSPAQILFRRHVRAEFPTDPRTIPLHRQWKKAARQREVDFGERNKSMVNSNDSSEPLSIGTTVLLQDPTNNHRWDKSGFIVDVDDDDGKYIIKMDGSGRVVTRNRSYIRPTHLHVESSQAELLNPTVSSDL